MCTITLSYNPNNALARRKLTDLLRSGLFTQVTDPIPADAEELENHREVRDAFYEGSKRSMSHLISRNV